MVKEVMDYLDCRPNGIYVDGTLGSGGHSREILKRSLPDGRLIGIDLDKEAISIASEKLKAFHNRVIFVNDNFKNLGGILKNLEVHEVDGILLDVGVSSIQLDDKERGFSFRREGPLDMRMDRDSAFKAFDLINGLPLLEIEQILRKYGEERFAKRIAGRIGDYRKVRPITTTTELADIVTAAIPRRFHPKRIHPATKTFQAVRISVNNELTNLEIAIHDGMNCLKRGGRFCIVSFHSLEDRIVKQEFRFLEKGCICPPNMPECNCNKERKGKVLTRKPILPSIEEKDRNPRSRTARLRAAERI